MFSLLSGCCPQPYLKLLIIVLVIAPIMIAPLQSIKAEPVSVAPPLSINTATVPAAAQSDPLGSPYPIPWNWETTYTNGSSKGARLHYFVGLESS